MTRSRYGLASTLVQRSKVRLPANKQTNVALLLSTAMVLAGILLYLWPQIRLVHLGYRQGVLQTQRAHILQQQQELQVELATLRQMSRIEDIATQHLGMRHPRISQVIYVRPEAHIPASRGRR